ncbi:cyclase family protein [Winogradskyella immobilis]|uniref:Cyclase family protein n=1 Tax=Winogradskyella immobilis TaxID=2816852 RepID=A0ABS8ERG3_9FLAO|nr:cyclase family protein [Winogradskyella immobilis]MCC1485486.1 cyclase family protein [Winogradskyella immobilis]MCG0017578.1 cyclase family protein [Winogradskyella immobilis]
MRIKLGIIYLLCGIILSCAKKKNELEPKIINEEIPKARRIIDLTHTFSEETVYWVTAKEFQLDVVAKGDTDKGFFYAANNFETAEHGGTHIDAPIHFSKGKHSTDEIPLERLIGKGIKIDVSANALLDVDYLVSVQDFLDWENENGQIEDGSIVLLQTGHSKYYPDKLKYLGTDERGDEAVKLLHFPGLSPEAATWLVENRNIESIGIDTPSIDYGQSEYFKSHVILLSENIPVFENVAYLDQLPNKDFEVIALPMKIKDGSGGPLRIIALINN